MNTRADTQAGNKNQAAANNEKSNLKYAANTQETVVQNQVHESINNSPHVSQLRAYQIMADQFTSETVQQKENIEEEILQGKSEPVQKKENNTGLPDNLKTGIENLSGYVMDDVRVHYNSGKPEQLQAHAYAQGTNIHLAPGQERHLPHEAWHVVQQKQGRVKPTLQMKGGINVNDDAGLESEADIMGIKAFQVMNDTIAQRKPQEIQQNAITHSSIIQRSVEESIESGDTNVAAAQNYAGQVQGKLPKYINKIKEMDESMDGQLEEYAENLAEGYDTWAANFLNKSAAYLYEAELAADRTDINGNPNVYAMLGVDTHDQPDLQIITNETLLSEDPFPVPVGQKIDHTSIEVKASTSELYKSVDGLVAGGMKQLRKREETGNYDYLELNVDNANSCWPITEHNFNYNYGGDFDNVEDDEWNDRLSERISQMRTTYDINLPLTVNLYCNGNIYAVSQTQ